MMRSKWWAMLGFPRGEVFPLSVHELKGGDCYFIVSSIVPFSIISIFYDELTCCNLTPLKKKTTKFFLHSQCPN